MQERRLFPTQVTQAVQVFVQKRVIGSALGSSITSAPWFLKLFRWFPFLQRIPGYMVGIGVRPEHICDRIRTPKFPS